LVKLDLLVLQDLLVQWLKVKRFLDPQGQMVLMELLVFLVTLVQKERWEQEEIWVQEVLLEKMDLKVLLVPRVKRVELEMLANQVCRDRKVTQVQLEKWDHLESKVHQDCLANQVNKEYLDCLEIRVHLEEKEILDHLVLMEKMGLMANLECLDLLETEANLGKMVVLEFKD